MDAMLQNMSAKHLGEWAEFERRDPSGEARADMRLAYGLAALASALTGKSQRPRDFLFEPGKPPQDWQDMRAQFLAAGRAANRAHHRPN